MKIKMMVMFFAAVLAAAVSAERVVSDFNQGWEFSADGKTFAKVDIPHDWAIEGPFDPVGDPHTAKLPYKRVAWYRKMITIKEKPVGKRVFLDFDGIMCDSTIYVNGTSCARQQYGYLGVRADITPYLNPGQNEIKVKADTTKLTSRWYPGGGMYRRVRMIETDDLYLDERDLHVTTPVVSKGKSVLNVKGAVTSRRHSASGEKVKVTLYGPAGDIVSEGCAKVDVSAYGKAQFELNLNTVSTELWDVEGDAAKLYNLKIALSGGDEISLKVGFRYFKFDPHKGFFLNGRRLEIKGVNLHSDLGILGVAYNRSANKRQLEAVRDLGANAVRLAHNPHSPETLELCDEMGLLVWDECFDKWNTTAGIGDEPIETYVPEKLKEFVRRDRNHPSVFIWSIGNEISPNEDVPPGQEHWVATAAIGTSAERSQMFRNVVRSLDTTRPVGMASCFPEAVPRGDYDPLDIVGWNYCRSYRWMKQTHPDKVMIYSETAATMSEFGYYAKNLPTNKVDFAIEDLSVDSYDRNCNAWSDIPDREFEAVEIDPYICGQFVWVGIDYLGEPTPYSSAKVIGWDEGIIIPLEKRARSTYYGIYDILCFPKDRAYLYKSQWNKKEFTLHIVPNHWTFPDRKGKVVPVYVYSSADEAELFLNGKSLGRRKKDPKAILAKRSYNGLNKYRLIWDDVVYEEGELKVVAYNKDGSVAGVSKIETASKPQKLVLRPESDSLPMGDDIVFVEVTLQDANGNRIPNDERRVRFEISSNGKIVSVGNGNPRGHDSFKDVASHPLRFGRMGLAVRREGKGDIILTAYADGVKSASFRFK
jgi:beta-galactosidase